LLRGLRHLGLHGRAGGGGLILTQIEHRWSGLPHESHSSVSTGTAAPAALPVPPPPGRRTAAGATSTTSRNRAVKMCVLFWALASAWPATETPDVRVRGRKRRSFLPHALTCERHDVAHYFECPRRRGAETGAESPIA